MMLKGRNAFLVFVFTAMVSHAYLPDDISIREYLSTAAAPSEDKEVFETLLSGSLV